jgi:adenylylsulfate kinase
MATTATTTAVVHSGFETRGRSMAKAISWRILAAIITATVALVMTHQLAFAAKIGAIDTSVKLLIYFLHERVWNKIGFGRVPAPDYEV